VLRVADEGYGAVERRGKPEPKKALCNSAKKNGDEKGALAGMQNQTPFF